MKSESYLERIREFFSSGQSQILGRAVALKRKVALNDRSAGHESRLFTKSVDNLVDNLP